MRKMIEKLKLRGFQKHRKRLLTFSPGITTITGPTDAGKSAILRALRWALLNDKPGAGFVRRGSKRASVTVLLKEFTLRRIQGAGQNEYRMNGKPFKSFGASVPDPIRSALAVDEISFQGQHDAPFWFSLSPGEVSRRLNAVIDLSVIDTALQKVSASVRSASERKRLSEEQLAEVKGELAELSGQQERIDEFARLQKTYETLEGLQEDTDQLSGLIQRIRDNRDKGDREKSEQGAAILQMGRGTLEVEVEMQELKGVILFIEAAASKLKKAQAEKRFVEIEFHKTIKGKNCPICQRPLPS